MLKKIVTSLGLIGISTLALAGSPGNSVVLPTGTPLLAWGSTSFWSLGIEGLYVQSTAPQYQYAEINTNTDPNKISEQTVDSNYHAGVELDATYHFAGNDRDATVSYMHVDMEDSSDSTIVGTETFNEPYGLLPARRDFVNEIKGETDQLYNAADFVFGQHLRVGQKLDIHPFGGIRYADLNDRDNSTYYNNPTESDTHTQATAQVSSHYEGLGPRVGVDMQFLLGQAFSIVGTIGGSLEVGYDNASLVTQSGSDLPITTDLDKNWYVVPELDAKLGLDYQHCFNPTTSLDFQAGYQVVNYFDAIETDTYDITTINSTVNQQNFGFQGPYLRLQLNLA
ncbi:MAG: hypothetical protein K2Q14_01095 [Gammaproteobacteria bacterium]|nr:hypothetical protein [Gammaproteobacteria bacterium]